MKRVFVFAALAFFALALATGPEVAMTVFTPTNLARVPAATADGHRRDALMLLLSGTVRAYPAPPAAWRSSPRADAPWAPTAASRQMNAQRAAAAEEEAAAKRATEAQILEDAGRLIAAWNERQAKRMLMSSTRLR